MVTRIIGIPDGNGVIRIACGEDIVEIQVAVVLPLTTPDKKKPSKPEPEPPRTGKPPDPRPIPPWKLPVPMWLEPAVIFDTPYILDVDEKLGLGGESVIAGIVDKVSAERLAPERPNPGALLLHGQRSIDIHALARLSTAMNRTVPGVMLGVAFDDG